MADTVAITAGAGTTIATDDLGAAGHVQRVKAVLGADGTGVDPIAVSAGLDSTGAGVAAVGMLAQFDDAATAAVTENQFAAPRLSTRRALLVEGVASGTAVNVAGPVTNAGAFAVQAAGTTAHGGAEQNPQQIGLATIAHGTNPTQIAAGLNTKWYANRHGIPFVMGGHPNILTLKHTTITTAVSDAAIVTVAAGLKIVVTRITVTLDSASTVFPSVIIGFATATTPTTTSVLVAHGGVPAGGGFTVGDGSGILGVGADNEDLRVTTTGNATGNGLWITVSYFSVES